MPDEPKKTVREVNCALPAMELVKIAAEEADFAVLSIAQVKAICELQDALRTLGGDLSYIMKEIKNLSDCVKRIPMNKTKWETGV